jgi:TatD DNase family protein
MYIDTHAHYDDPQFDSDRAAVLQRIQEAGVEAVINCACDPKSCRTTLRLMKEYPFLYGALGYHPHDTAKLTEDAVDVLYDALSASEKVVAVGEIGLDYHYTFSPREVQQEWFIEQIELAKELELPLIIHSREALEDTYRILKEGQAYRVGGVIHAFSGSLETAKRYLDMGFYLGIGGMVTFPDTKKLLRALPEIPMDRILLETDCPYLAPVPHRGERNDSGNLRDTAAKIAEIKGMTVEEVAEQTAENARTLFGIRSRA